MFSTRQLIFITKAAVIPLGMIALNLPLLRAILRPFGRSILSGDINLFITKQAEIPSRLK
jgi:hypothetical protein